MKIPQLARYNGTVAKAYEFVEDNITSFPVKPFELVKKFKWGLLTYEEMATKNKCTIEDIIECLGTDGYSIYNGHNYTIAYNNINNPGRINFTIAHEIGHIILNHHKDFEVTEVLQDNFSKEEYKILENEANCFARNILAPAPLVNQMNLFNRFFSMSSNFAITSKAVTTRISFLKNDLFYLNDEQISNFQTKYKPFKICTECKNTHLNIKSNYCSFCGSKKLTIGDGFMIYKSEIETDENNKAKKCPRCGNEEILEGSYCKICGLELYNRCTNYEEDGYGNITGGCAQICDSNARYCHKCGAETSFYQNKLLSSYTKYEPEHESIKMLWQEILSELKQSNPITLYTSLVNTTLCELNSDTIRIDIKNLNEFTKVILSKKENISILKNLFKNKYGKIMHVNLYDLNQKKYIYEDLDLQPAFSDVDDELPF